MSHGYHGQGGTGAGTPEDLGVVSGCGDQGHDIAHHIPAHMGVGHQILKLRQGLLVQHGLQAVEGIAPLAAQDHGDLILGVGITQAQADGEAVHLAVGQQLGTGGTGGVLGGDDHEGSGQGMGHAVHGDLTFFHGFQQSGLGPGGGPV